MSKGWINEFCFEKSEFYKKNNIKNYQQINLTDVYFEFQQYIKKRDNKFELKLGEVELKYLKNIILASISRNLWDNNTYYEILAQEDEYIIRAIKELDKNELN